MKIITFGVRQPERKIFEEENTYGYEIQMESGNLNESTMDICKGFDAVIVRASDTINETVVSHLKNEFGIKYILTRTAGYNHMDEEALKKHNVLSARVPGYSPSAISEVAFSTAMALNRRVWQTADAVSKGKYKIQDEFFAKEIKNSKVGVIGVGRIGLTTAKFFKAVGATVIGYDKYESDAAKETLEFVSEDELLAQSDIIITHMAYIKGQNDNFFNDETFGKMKDGAIFINAARGELMDDEALLRALESNKLAAVATDVLRNEKTFFNKADGKPGETHQKLIDLYPRFVVTTHIGSYTDSAVQDMVSISYKNLDILIKDGTCPNQIGK